ncbi:hypothetical protein N7478_005834 [Penicillium angulare]|uniref:uncharacterized protein n=1 Tax=Penicillium angulare TaxID=116970 RepID=UPI00253FAE4C|nr:uncharacterized protein N7478_005834 [Penicillium angulare]KAJ5280462.1 hypothetical protein N7478_005834 [Penicillium angulare]
MAFLFDKFEQQGDQDLRLDFFFTTRGTEMQRTPLGMFRSLLRQIFTCDISVRPKLCEILEQRSMQFGEAKWEWPRVVLEKLLADIILESASRQHVTVFIDALDEAGAESAQQLAAYFHRIIDRAGERAVHVCISCRHYPIARSARPIDVHMENHNHDDIAAYIRNNLTETDTGDSSSKDSETEQLLLAEQLIQQANGSFQWAHLVIPLAQRKVFEGESLKDIQCWLKEVPDDLEETHTYILCSVIETRNRQQSYLLFLWICLAERPLSVTEIRYALNVSSNAQVTHPSSSKPWEMAGGHVESDERMKRRIKALSGGLAEVLLSGDDIETIQVVHRSVSYFLHTKGLGLWFSMINTGKWHVVGDSANVLQCQGILYQSCLAYLAEVPLPQERSHQTNYKYDIIDGSNITKCSIHTTQHVRHITQVIHVAAAIGSSDSIESLSDGDIAMTDDHGNTALYLAAQRGHIVTGETLLEREQTAKQITKVEEHHYLRQLAMDSWDLLSGSSKRESSLNH